MNSMRDIWAIVVLGDGRFVVGGSIKGQHRTGIDFALMRYNTNGTVDMTFPSGGTATTDFFGSDDFIHALRIDGNNNILVAGNATNGSGSAAEASQRHPIHP